MRRSIQDLVLSIDPNIKIEPEVEDVRRVPLFSPPPSLPFFWRWALTRSFLILILLFYFTV
jgi:hypothetical protein